MRDVQPGADRPWLEEYVATEWGSPLQARRGELIDVRALPALMAERNGRPAGMLCYRDDGGGSWELVLIHAEPGRTGAGTALVDALVDRVGAGSRIWVVTTNDNVDALRFYQRRDFRLCAVRPGAVDEARRTLKPEIPEIGRHGIPLRDELELERFV